MKIEKTYCPTRIVFGENSLEYLKDIKKNYNNIFILATKSLSEKFQQEIKNYLGDSIENFTIGQLSGEPTEENINELLKKKTQNTDCIIGIGGGSYLDASKVIAIQEEKLSNFNEKSKVLPIVAIPTTAGTGSETSKSATIKRNGIKQGVRSENLIPHTAIVDPRLCETLPIELTIYTGFDALTHTIETYMSKSSTQFTKMLSEKTIKDLFIYLPRAKKEFKESGKISIETRSKLSYAAMLQGINLLNSTTCLGHRIQYALSTVSNATHAQGLASIFRSWLKHSKPIIAGYDYNQIIALMDELEINITLKDIGIHKEDIEKVLNSISGTLENDPCYQGKETIKEILEESL